MYYDDTIYLEHHGILGMHWGIRRERNEAGIIAGAGKKFANTKSDFENLKNNPETRDKIKKGAKIAAAIAATGIAVYGIKSGKAKQLYYSGKALLPFDVRSKLTDVEVGLHKKINPNYLTGKEKALKQLSSTPPPITPRVRQQAKSLVSSNSYKSMSSITGKPSAATQAILDANQAHSMKKKLSSGTVKTFVGGSKITPTKQKVLSAMYDVHISQLQSKSYAKQISAFDAATSQLISSNNKLLSQM